MKEQLGCMGVALAVTAAVLAGSGGCGGKAAHGTMDGAVEQYIRQKMLQPWESLEEVTLIERRTVGHRLASRHELVLISRSLDPADSRTCTRQVILEGDHVRLTATVSGGNDRAEEKIVPSGGTVLSVGFRVRTLRSSETLEGRAQRWQNFDHACYTANPPRRSLNPHDLYHVLFFLTPDGRCVGHFPGHFWNDYVQITAGCRSPDHRRP